MVPGHGGGQAGKVLPPYVGALVLAGVELIFAVVAGVGLCFGFFFQTALITQGWFSPC